MKHSLFRALCVTVAIGATDLAFAAAPPAKEKIGAIGRIAPAGEVVYLIGPGGDQTAEVRVTEGLSVRAGDPLVVLAGKAIAESELRMAELTLREVEEVGAKNLRLQELAVERARRGVALAKERLDRYHKLQGSSISQQETELRQYQVGEAELSCVAAEEQLSQMRLNREIAQSRAREQIHLSREKVAKTTVVAPTDGTILQIQAKVVENTGGYALVTMADLRQMVIMADVFEGDLAKVTVGAAATATNSTLTQPLAGKVTHIGRVINSQTKVARVRIVLDESERAAFFIGMEVNVSIAR
jgi:HlyD family secretion protein